VWLCGIVQEEKDPKSMLYVELKKGKDEDCHGFGFASSK